MARPRATHISYTLIQRGSRFYVTWWESGQQHRVSTRTDDEREARTWLKQFEAGRGTPAPPDEPTIRQIAAGYLADRMPRVAAPNTLRHAVTALTRHLGDLQPAHLTRERCRAYHMARRTEGHQAPGAKRRKAVGPGTVIRELVTLRAAFRWAIREQWISAEPYVEMPPAPPPRDRWLTRQEADRLLAEAKAPHVHLFLLLGLHTAARKEALLTLTWDQVDLKAGRIRLGESVGKKRRAIVPINDVLREGLEDAYQGRTGTHVIEHGGNPVTSIRTGIAAAARRAKLEGVTANVLRHTAASWMVQAGVPLAKVSAFLGNTEAMVDRVYGHHAPDWLDAAAKALAG